MKKILTNQFWKSLIGIGGILLVSLLFRFIENQTIKTLIGMGGFLLIFISLRKLKNKEN
jgi:hypothetical protein